MASRGSGAWQAWLVGGLALVGFLVFRFEVLTMPLYEDQSVGFGREADFLDQTGFDYRRLRYDERHFMFGGTARSYMISVIPTALAGLRRLMGSVPTTLLVWHLLSFVTASVVAGMFFGLVRPWTGAILAWVATLALVSTPMFLAQVDLAGMELPLVACVLGAGLALARGKEYQALAWSVAAFFMKATGLVVLVAILLVLAARRRRTWGALVAGTALVVGEVALLSWADDTALFRATFHWPSGFRFPRALVWCPDLAVLTLLSAGVAGLVVWRRGVLNVANWLTSLWRNGEPAAEVTLWSVFVLGATWVSMIGYICIPRYYILPLVMVYVVLAILLATSERWQRRGIVLLALVSGVNLVNHRGSLYPPVEWVAGKEFTEMTTFTLRSCGFTERSLEYLDDHRSSVAAVGEVMKRSENGTIFAEMPHWIYLSSPFVGYVAAPPVDLVRADQFTDAVRGFRDRALTTPSEHGLIFLWSEKGSTRMPMMKEDVRILYQDQMASPLVVGEIARERLPRTALELEDWYLDHSWDDRHALHRVLDRYDFLKRTGRLERARRELHYASWMYPTPTDPDVARILPRLRADVDQTLAQRVILDGKAWQLRSEPGASAMLSVDGSTKTMKVVTGSVPMSRLDGVVVASERVEVDAGDRVRVRFDARSRRPSRMRLRWGSLFEGNKTLAAREEMEVRESWQTFEKEFVMRAREVDAELIFEVGRESWQIEWRGISIENSGEVAGLPP